MRTIRIQNNHALLRSSYRVRELQIIDQNGEKVKLVAIESTKPEIEKLVVARKWST